MQKTTRLQRLLAVVVAVFMAVCCLPLSAFAAGEAGTTSDVNLTINYLDVDGDNKILAQENMQVVAYAVTDENDAVIGFNYYISPEDFIKSLKKIPENYSIVNFQESAPISLGVDKGDSGKAVLPIEVKLNETKPEPEVKDAVYELNFVDQDGNPVKSFNHSGNVIKGEDNYLLSAIQPSIDSVLQDGYELNKVEFADDGAAVDKTTVMTAGDVTTAKHKLVVYVTEKATAPVLQDAIYELNFVDQDGNPVKSFSHNGTVVEGETTYLLSAIEPSVQTVLDKGYELRKVEFADDGAVVDKTTVMTAGDVTAAKHKLVIHVTEKASTPVFQDAIYELNFVDQDGNGVASFAHNGTVIEGETTYLLSAIEPSVKTVLDKGYELRKVEFANGDAVDKTTVMTAGDVTADKHKLVVHVTKKTEVEWLDAIYELNFVDQDGKNIESFQHNGTIMKGETTYLLAALEPSVKTVLDKGYDLRKVEFSSGDPVDETTVMTAGNVGTDKHKVVVHVTKKATASTGDDNKTESSSNNNTTTVSSNNNKTTTANNTQVVKAAAPADNTAKVMPQTGLTAETPVVFGVMMVAALAGAGAYLFAIRKKLN